MPSLIAKILNNLSLSDNQQPYYPVSSFSQQLYSDLSVGDHFYLENGGGLGRLFTRQEHPLIKSAFAFQTQISEKTSARIYSIESLNKLADAFNGKPKDPKINININKYALCHALICQQLMNNKKEFIAFNSSFEKLNKLYGKKGELNSSKDAESIRTRLKHISTNRKIALQNQITANDNIAMMANTTEEHKEPSSVTPHMLFDIRPPEESKAERIDSTNIDPSVEVHNPATSPGLLSIDINAQALTDVSSTPTTQPKEQEPENTEANTDISVSPPITPIIIISPPVQENTDTAVRSALQEANSSQTNLMETKVEEKEAPKADSGQRAWEKVKEKLKERGRLNNTIDDFYIRLEAKTRYFNEKIIPTLSADEAISLSHHMYQVQEDRVPNLYFKDELDSRAGNLFTSWLNCFGQPTTGSFQAERHETKNQIIKTTKPATLIDHKKIYHTLSQHSGYPLTRWGETGTAKAYRNKFNLERTPDDSVRLKK